MEVSLQFRNLHYVAQCKCGEQLCLSSEEGRWVILKEDVESSVFEKMCSDSGAGLNIRRSKVCSENKWDNLEEYLLAVSIGKIQIAERKHEYENGKQIWKKMGK